MFQTRCQALSSKIDPDFFGTLMRNTYRGRCMLRLKVKEIAEQKGYNQSTLSRASDVPINTIRRIWRNPYYEVRLATLNKIAVVLEVPTTDLFEDVSEADS